MQTRLLKDLAYSIRTKGLLHPIVVRPLGRTPEVYQLICGERRFRAFQLLQKEEPSCATWSVIPATLFTDLSPTQRVEAELEENILREDLSWTDRTAAIAKLHALRGGTVTDTAKELASYEKRGVEAARAETTRALVVAQNLEDPTVKNARSEREAYRILLAKDEVAFRTRLQELGHSPSPHTLIEGDLAVVEWPTSLDCVIADPPYGLKTEHFGLGQAHLYDDSLERAQVVYAAIINRATLACKPAAHLYLFCDIDTFLFARTLCEEHNWSTYRQPLIWHRGGQGTYIGDPGVGLQRSYEMILFAHRGNRLSSTIMQDVISVPNTIGTEPLHPAAKPPALYLKLLDRSTSPGDRVLDPCCGSGPIFPAATTLRLTAFGIELNPEYAKVARSRLSDEGVI